MVNLNKDEVQHQDMTIDHLIAESFDTAMRKGWWDKVDKENFGLIFSEKLALMHSELSETLEEYRSHGLDSDTFIYYDEETGKPEGIAVELADLLIRVFDTCGYYRIPLTKALMEKMEYNKSRPYRHGGKLA